MYRNKIKVMKKVIGYVIIPVVKVIGPPKILSEVRLGKISKSLTPIMLVKTIIVIKTAKNILYVLSIFFIFLIS